MHFAVLRALRLYRLIRLYRRTRGRHDPDYAATTRALDVPRAPGLALTQILTLPLLAPEIQEHLVRDEVPTERRLRPAVGQPDWANQLALVAESSNHVLP